MKRVIITQLRLIIGTVVMWLVGSLIFGTNLISYGITHVIRMCFYVQGAFLVITLVGYPLVVLDILGDLVEWLQITNERYAIFTSNVNDIGDFTDEEFGLQSDVIVNFEITEEEEEIIEVPSVDGLEAEQFLLEIEEEIRKQLPEDANDKETRVEYRKTLNDNEKRDFDALWFAVDSIETARLIKTGPDRFFKIEKSGEDIVPVLEAETFGEGT